MNIKFVESKIHEVPGKKVKDREGSQMPNKDCIHLNISSISHNVLNIFLVVFLIYHGRLYNYIVSFLMKYQ